MVIVIIETHFLHCRARQTSQNLPRRLFRASVQLDSVEMGILIKNAELK